MAALSLVISFPVAFLAAHVEQLSVTRWRSDSFPTCWKNTPHMHGRCSWKRALNKRYPKLYPWELDKMFFFKNTVKIIPTFFFPSLACVFSPVSPLVWALKESFSHRTGSTKQDRISQYRHLQTGSISQCQQTTAGWLFRPCSM